MSRNKRKNKNYQTFVRLPHHMLDSAAWRSLSSNARAAWLVIGRRHNGFNNGDISLSVREAAENLGVSKNTAARAICQLIDRGFIKVCVNSGFNIKSGRRARRFALTHVVLNARRPTDDWRRWQPQK